MSNLRALRARSMTALAVAAVVAATACTPTFSTTADTTTTFVPPPRTVLRVGVEEWPACLNPLLCDDAALSQQILHQVLPGAYRLDDANSYAPTGLLAEPARVESSAGGEDGDGGMTIRYRIDPAARWADGTPITSTDFLGTWRAVMTTPGADTRGYDLISGVDDRDPLEAVVTLDRAYAEWRELFGGSRNHLLKADAFGATTDLTGLYEDELPFAAGPYRLVSWSENEAVLSRVDNEWDPARRAVIDQVRLRPVRVGEASPDAFDVLVPAATRHTVPPEGYSVYEVPTTKVIGIWPDQRTPELAVLAHRRFLRLGVDVDELLQAAADVTAVAGPVGCTGWVPGVGPWCDAAATGEAVHDPQRALALLEAEGWLATPEGPLQRDGAPLTMPVTWDPSDPAAGRVAAEVSDTLAALGIDVAIGAMPTQRWASGRVLDASVGVGVYTLDLGTGAVPALYACPGGATHSVIAWCPDANQVTLAALADTVDPDDQVELVRTLGRRAHGDAAWIPVAQLADRFYARTERVVIPDLTRAVGGPLAQLAQFEVVT